MKPYSEDLRWRVVRAVDEGTPRAEVAWRFAVAVPTIERWLRLRREAGGLAPRPVPGAAPTATAGLAEALPERLAERPDATLAEHGAWWRERSGRAASVSTMSRALAALGWTRTKRP